MWRHPLPTISVPLLPEDDDVLLDLAAAFADAYEPAYYQQRLPYGSPLSPPLSVDEQEWVRQQISTK